MSLSINTNVNSLTAQRNLGMSQTALATSMQRLSSGLRVNSAKDDAAGLAISERMNAQVRGLNVAARNANDAISLAQTAEGALGKIGDMLQRMRELSVQSANATNSQTDRDALQAEAAQLKDEIQRVATTTKFNNTSLLDGTFTSKSFQVGANQGETITLASVANANTAKLGSWTSIATPAVATGAVPAGSAATAAVAGTPAVDGTTTIDTTAFGAPTNADGFNYDAFSIDVNGTTVNVAATTTATTAAEGKTAMMANVKAAIEGASIAGLTIDGSVADTLTFTNTSATAVAITDTTGELGGDIAVAAQTPAVAGTAADPGGAFVAIAAGEFTINGTSVTVGAAADATTRLNDLVTAINANVTGVTASVVSGKLQLSSSSDIVVAGSGNVTQETGLSAGTTTPVAGTAQTGVANVDISTTTGANNAMLAIDAALTAVNTARGTLGAVQSRFENAIANIQVTAENLSAARGRIVDADFAAETANMSRANILQQAGTAMVAQANQLPQQVLQLLR